MMLWQLKMWMLWNGYKSTLFKDSTAHILTIQFVWDYNFFYSLFSLKKKAPIVMLHREQ